MSENYKNYFEQRALLLKKCRNWFEQHPALEVDTPAISQYANTDVNLDSFKVKGSTLQGFLNTSPEFAIKQLLAKEKLGDCYQIAKVFRDGETGKNHLPEFTLLEWYRMGWDEFQLMEEVAALLECLLAAQSPEKAEYYSYTRLFANYCSLDIRRAEIGDYVNFCQSIQLDYPQIWQNTKDIDAFQDLILSQYISPKFYPNALTFVYHYPQTQSSLAKCITTEEGRVAQRFEIYWGNLELGNGFNELQNAAEQLSRFQKDNQIRLKQGKEALPIDIGLINALKTGLPQCSGVAVGIERILKIIIGCDDIRELGLHQYQ